MHVSFVRSNVESAHFKTFWFRPDRPVRFVAGQFTEICLLHSADARGDKRWFTISSSPADDLISITTRIDPDRPSSFKQALLKLKPGDELTFADPMGDFVLPKKKDLPLVFVAGGIGITPMHSMIKSLVGTTTERNISLYYAVKTPEDAVFIDFFETSPIALTIIAEHPPKTWRGLAGRLSAKMIAGFPGVKDNALVYLSGPEPMVESLYKNLKVEGVPEQRLVTDYFPGYTEDDL